MKRVMSAFSSFSVTTLSCTLTFTTFFLKVNVGSLRFVIESHMDLYHSQDFQFGKHRTVFLFRLLDLKTLLLF